MWKGRKFSLWKLSVKALSEVKLSLLFSLFCSQKEGFYYLKCQTQKNLLIADWITGEMRFPIFDVLSLPGIVIPSWKLHCWISAIVTRKKYWIQNRVFILSVDILYARDDLLCEGLGGDFLQLQDELPHQKEIFIVGRLIQRDKTKVKKENRGVLGC